MIKRSFIMSLLMLAGFMIGCEKDPPLTNSEKIKRDIEEIEKYLEKEGLTAEKHESGFFYIIHEPGSGDVLNDYSEVNIKYEGTYLKDGKTFDTKSSYTTLLLYEVNAGFRLGIPLIKKGGSVSLYLPRYFASPTDITIYFVKVEDVYK